MLLGIVLSKFYSTNAAYIIRETGVDKRLTKIQIDFNCVLIVIKSILQLSYGWLGLWARICKSV